MWSILLITLMCTGVGTDKCYDATSHKVNTNTISFGSYETEQKCKDAIKPMIINVTIKTGLPFIWYLNV